MGDGARHRGGRTQLQDYIEDFTLTVAELIEVIGVLVCFGGELRIK